MAKPDDVGATLTPDAESTSSGGNMARPTRTSSRATRFRGVVWDAEYSDFDDEPARGVE